MDHVTASSRGFLFRVGICLAIFIFPFIPPLYRGLFLIFASDLLDYIFFKKWYSEEERAIVDSYSYHLTDKISDALTNFLGLLLLSVAKVTDLGIVYAMLIWRIIGLMIFTQIRSSYIWVIFPDLTKELLLARYLFGEINPTIFVVVFILKAGFEYYHHFLKNRRTFDHHGISHPINKI